jgi:hypothetical protein
MVELINERYATYYHASKGSTTFFFCLVIYFLIIIVPFLIGFTSTGIKFLYSIARFLDSGAVLLWAADSHITEWVHDCCADSERGLLLYEYPRHYEAAGKFIIATHHFSKASISILKRWVISQKNRQINWRRLKTSQLISRCFKIHWKLDSYRFCCSTNTT